MVSGLDTVTYVDIRNSRDFVQYHIPGSMNIEPHELKKKTYLKHKELVIFNEGHSYKSLEALYADLERTGFEDVHILEGGLAAWYQAGGELDGDPVAERNLNRMTSAQFMQEHDYAHWVIVDVSNYSTIPQEEIERRFRKDLHTALLKRGRELDKGFVLVVSEDGSGYERIEPITQSLGNFHVFYLEGGRKAYEEQVNRQVAMWNKTAHRVGEVPRCGRM